MFFLCRSVNDLVRPLEKSAPVGPVENATVDRDSLFQSRSHRRQGSQKHNRSGSHAGTGSIKTQGNDLSIPLEVAIPPPQIMVAQQHQPSPTLSQRQQHTPNSQVFTATPGVQGGVTGMYYFVPSDQQQQQPVVMHHQSPSQYHQNPAPLVAPIPVNGSLTASMKRAPQRMGMEARVPGGI